MQVYNKTSDHIKARKIFIFQLFSEQLKFHEKKLHNIEAWKPKFYLSRARYYVFELF